MKTVKHKSVGTELTQAEFEATDAHEWDSGTVFPGAPDTGDFFLRTDSNHLYMFNGNDWRSLDGGEGEFNTWTLQWTKTTTVDWEVFVPVSCEITTSKENDLLTIHDGYTPMNLIINLVDGTLISKDSSVIDCTYYRSTFSTGKRYHVKYTKDGGTGHNLLVVYKDCVQVFSVDITATLGWAYTDYYHPGAVISQDGEWLLVWDNASYGIAIFQGSEE